jgi:5'-nucleotidase (lipoprotein e(P4) family)
MRKRILKNAVFAMLMVTLLLTVSTPTTADSESYTTQDLNEQLVMGTVWYQKSAEMRAISYQAFNMARLVFDMDLEEVASAQKRAVVVDIDETVLDNSPYEAGIVGKDSGYPTGWAEWIDAAEAEPLPGAVEFCNYVVEKGADVFYLSNRKAESEQEATMKNLKAWGFPQVIDTHMLLKEDTSDKEPRRLQVRAGHRIVLMIGDNLNDFDNIFRKKGVDERLAAVDTVKDDFGTKFIVLPNPMYGDWEGAVYDYNWKMSPKEKSDTRKSSLTTWSQ